MEKLVIEGGPRLEGNIYTSGAKNSALPVLAACLLTDEPVTLHRIPRVRDIRTMEKLLTYIGAEIEEKLDGSLVVHARTIQDPSSAVRPGEDDARFEPGARTAGRHDRQGARFHARWLRHWGAAHQPACQRTRTTRREDHAGARVH